MRLVNAKGQQRGRASDSQMDQLYWEQLTECTLGLRTALQLVELWVIRMECKLENLMALHLE